MHLLFFKYLLGVKIQTQNNFIYGELERMTVSNCKFLILFVIGLNYYSVTILNTQTYIQFDVTISAESSRQNILG